MVLIQALPSLIPSYKLDLVVQNAKIHLILNVPLGFLCWIVIIKFTIMIVSINILFNRNRFIWQPHSKALFGIVFLQEITGDFHSKPSNRERVCGCTAMLLGCYLLVLLEIICYVQPHVDLKRTC